MLLEAMEAMVIQPEGIKSALAPLLRTSANKESAVVFCSDGNMAYEKLTLSGMVLRSATRTALKAENEESTGLTAAPEPNA